MEKIKTTKTLLWVRKNPPDSKHRFFGTFLFLVFLFSFFSQFGEKIFRRASRENTLVTLVFLWPIHPTKHPNNFFSFLFFSSLFHSFLKSTNELLNNLFSLNNNFFFISTTTIYSLSLSLQFWIGKIWKRESRGEWCDKSDKGVRKNILK